MGLAWKLSIFHRPVKKSFARNARCKIAPDFPVDKGTAQEYGHFMKSDRRQSGNWHAILHIMLCLGTGTLIAIGMLIWLHTPPAKAKQLLPLLKEIEDYKAINGVYPDSCTNFSSFSKLTNQFKIFVGSGSDVPADTFYDFALLLNPDDYKAYFPVSVANPLNFTAWRYDSNTHYWRKGRIHAPVWGSSWSIQWKPSFP